MGFEVVTERVDMVDLSGERKQEILNELRNNKLLERVLDDINNGYGMDLHYSGREVLTELTKVPIDTSEAYSALHSAIAAKLWDANLKVHNLEKFKDAISQPVTVNAG